MHEPRTAARTSLNHPAMIFTAWLFLRSHAHTHDLAFVHVDPEARFALHANDPAFGAHAVSDDVGREVMVGHTDAPLEVAEHSSNLHQRCRAYARLGDFAREVDREPERLAHLPRVHRRAQAAQLDRLEIHARGRAGTLVIVDVLDG